MSSKAAREKKRLKSIIKYMAKEREHFVKCMEKDFTRHRKLNFETVLSVLLTMNGGSTAAGLLEYFKFSPQLSSTSAFVQQRSKLKPEAMQRENIPIRLISLLLHIFAEISFLIMYLRLKLKLFFQD